MKISVIMGSDSDYEIVKEALSVLKHFGITCEAKILSAHRTPHQTVEYVKKVECEGVEVFIGCAGKAAHLAGVIAGVTTCPVIGLPIKTSLMGGLDSLLSMVQMPSGVPVATVAVNGAKNAALLAVQILSIKYPPLKNSLIAYKQQMADEVMLKDKKLSETLQGGL